MKRRTVIKAPEIIAEACIAPNCQYLEKAGASRNKQTIRGIHYELNI